jgi:hypothetical protein
LQRLDPRTLGGADDGADRASAANGVVFVRAGPPSKRTGSTRETHGTEEAVKVARLRPDSPFLLFQQGLEEWGFQISILHNMLYASNKGSFLSALVDCKNLQGVLCGLLSDIELWTLRACLSSYSQLFQHSSRVMSHFVESPCWRH